MKITGVRTYIVDGGFRPWTFVKIETSDDGLIGWGDCTDWGSPGPVAAMVARFAELIVGRDPTPAVRDWTVAESPGRPLPPPHEDAQPRSPVPPFATPGAPRTPPPAPA